VRGSAATIRHNPVAFEPLCNPNPTLCGVQILLERVFQEMPMPQPAPWIWSREERVGNWLALGVLLAAWNAADQETPPQHGAHVVRPQALAAQPIVTVRVLTGHGMIPFGSGRQR
jgi:hypothetical protein